MSNEPIASDLPGWPEIDFSEFGPVERRPLGRIQKLTARFLGRNWIAIPHVTHHDEIDITLFEERRLAWNAAHPHDKVTVIAPLTKAVAEALKAHPRFNSSLEADKSTLVQKGYFNVGIAVDTPHGLLVAVLRAADSKSIGVLGKELVEVAQKARTKGLSLQSGGWVHHDLLARTYRRDGVRRSSTPGGGCGSVSRLQVRAARRWRGDMAQDVAALSYDHRVINGAEAARFVCTIGSCLADIDSFL